MTVTSSTDAATEGHEAVALLERTRTVVHPELRAAVESLPGSVRRVAMYHFGWEHADGTPAAGPRARRSDPRWSSRRSRALGGEPAPAVGPLSPVELAHNFTLLHDDVIDEDPTRRHRPTAWTVFGTPTRSSPATPCRRWRCGCSPRTRTRRRPPAAGPARDLCHRAVRGTAGGLRAGAARPARGLAGRVCRPWPMAKTGALLGYVVRARARCTRARSDEEVAALDAFGREAGLAFQLIDDLIGIWGDPRPYGQTGRRGSGRPQEVPAGGRRAGLGHPGGRGAGRAVQEPDGRRGRPAGGRRCRTGRRARLGAGPGGRPDVPGGPPAVPGGPRSRGGRRPAGPGGVRHAPHPLSGSYGPNRARWRRVGGLCRRHARETAKGWNPWRRGMCGTSRMRASEARTVVMPPRSSIQAGCTTNGMPMFAADLRIEAFETEVRAGLREWRNRHHVQPEEATRAAAEDPVPLQSAP